MEIDIRTLAIVLAIVADIQAIAFFFQYLINKTYRGIGWWVLGSTLAAVGYVLLLLQDTNPILFIILANTLLISGAISIYIGITRFLDQEENRWIIIAILAVFLISFFYHTYGNNDITVRTVIFSVTLAIISFLTALSLFGNKIRSISTSAHLIAAVFLAYGFFFIFRAVAVFAIAPVDTLFTPSLIQTATFLSSLIEGLFVMVGLIIMVNQRLNSEMSEAKEEFELIFNTSPDAALISRLDDGIIVNINDGFTAITGFTGEDTIGRSCFDINLWADPVSRQKIVAELKKKGFCDNFEAEFHRKDMSIFPGLVSAKVIILQDILHIISVTRDVTERKKAEETLRESEIRYRQLVDATVEGIIIHREGIIKDLNERACELFGYSHDEMIGKNVLTLAAPEFVETIKEKITTGSEDSYEARGLRKDGSMFWADMHSHQIIVGGELYRITTLWDITERKRADVALQQANNKLTMLNSITRHDILNQLMGLRTYLELSKEDVTDPVFLGYIQKEEEAAETIQWQIEFARDYQDIGTMAPKWQNLSDIIDSATKQLKPSGSRINVHVTGVEIFADPLIEKVFYTLMENSLRHGVHVTQMDYSLRETTDDLIIIYCDDGVGIAIEDKKKLFLKGFGKHTGLGLFLSKEILSITGITIGENGEPGKGVRFEIAVPKGMWRSTGNSA
ncbi:MAG: PAS domain S-box protein [Methanoregula sp.]|nr:PAS domain S-box protein [Methanoregula sp.]